MADRPEVETVGAGETVQLLAQLGARVGMAAVFTPVTYPWLRSGQPVRSLLDGYERQSLKELLTYAEALETPQLRSIERVIDAAAAQVLPVPWRRGSVTIEPDVVGGLPGEWVRPHDSAGRDQMLYLHGGGYVAAGPRMFRGFVTRLVTEIGIPAFVPDYRLAPEFPYPAALDDAVAAFGAMQADLDSDEIDFGRLVVAGDSAGGGLTAALLAELSATDQRLPAAAVMFSPEVDLTLSKESVQANAATDILPNHPDVASYLHGVDPRSNLVSPLYSDMSGFPPMMVVAGGQEMFRDQIEAYAAAAGDAGVDVQFHEAPHMEHVFEVVSPFSRATEVTMDEVARFVQLALS